METVINDSTRNLEGASQPTLLKVLGSVNGDVNHLAHFDNNKIDSRSEITVSNSSTAWNNNFVSLMVHGPEFPHDHYAGLPNSGLAALLAQGAELKYFAVGTYHGVPLIFFTNNTQVMSIEANGDIYWTNAKTEIDSNVNILNNTTLNGVILRQEAPAPTGTEYKWFKINHTDGDTVQSYAVKGYKI